jgi:hypothetical protein
MIKNVNLTTNISHIKVKVKLSRYRPGQALGGSRRLRLLNF